MIILITGATHTGKTNLSQKLLEKYKYPYLSIDHLKMGLIRSGYTNLTPEDDENLTEYMWPIICGMIKTAIENNQNLIIEGGYIPFGYEKDFSYEELSNIKYISLIMTENYIKTNYFDIIDYAEIIEKRKVGTLYLDDLIKENKYFLENCKRYGYKYILIDNEYNINL